MGCLNVQTSLVSKHLKVVCSLVCNVSIETKPIEVLPEEVQWISIDRDVTYNITTRRRWVIE